MYQLKYKFLTLDVVVVHLPLVHSDMVLVTARSKNCKFLSRINDPTNNVLLNTPHLHDTIQFF